MESSLQLMMLFRYCEALLFLSVILGMHTSNNEQLSHFLLYLAGGV